MLGWVGGSVDGSTTARRPACGASRMEGGMGGWMGGWVEGWVDGCGACVHACLVSPPYTHTHPLPPPPPQSTLLHTHPTHPF